MSIYIHVYRFTDVYSHVCALAFIKTKMDFYQKRKKKLFSKTRAISHCRHHIFYPL